MVFESHVFRLIMMQHLLFDVAQWKFVSMSTFTNHLYPSVEHFCGSDLAITIFSIKRKSHFLVPNLYGDT